MSDVMMSVEELKDFLREQAKTFEPTNDLERFENVDKQLSQTTSDTGMVFYLDRSGEMIEIKCIRLDLRGNSPRTVTREEWLEIQETEDE